MTNQTKRHRQRLIHVHLSPWQLRHDPIRSIEARRTRSHHRQTEGRVGSP